MSILSPGGLIVQENTRLLRNSSLTTMPSSQREWNSFMLEFNKWITHHEGSFIATYNGFSSPPLAPTGTALVNWVRFGPIVHARLGGSTKGTSDDTVFEITNVPEELRPDTAQIYWFFGAHDNGLDSSVPVSAFIDPAGSIAFGLGVGNETGGGWTSSAAKGWQNGSITISWSTWSKGMSAP